MRIHSESRIHHPIDRVYRAYRDRLPEIANFIPDVKEIRVLSREETAEGLRLHNEWVSDREVPPVAQGLVGQGELKWDDHAEWHDADRYVAWNLVIPAFPEQVRCSGRNTFIADGEGATRVVLTGELEIRIDRLPGVPGFMARRIAPKVEEFIVKLVTPNLKQVNVSLQEFLDQQD